MNSAFSSIVFSMVAPLLLLTSPGAGAQSVDELLKKGEVFDQRFEAGEALNFYLAAEKLEPKNVRILVRIARQYRHLMADTTAKEEKLRLGRIALGYAQRAAALAPNDAEAQLSIAITYGKMLPFLGTKEQVDTSPRIKSAVDKTLQLDPTNDTAWHILGRWHRVLADVSALKRALAAAIYGRLPKGSNEEAVKCLEKAIALNPNRSMHYIELGRVYAQMGRKNDARKFIQKGLAMPNVEKDDPETKARGRETLEKLR
jgi:tetratricopeptide (TPR) repeat protein